MSLAKVEHSIMLYNEFYIILGGSACARKLGTTE